MSGRFPDQVDVAIVGSGPTGATYARVLSEEAPHLRVALLEVGPTITDPPGSHVKNIADLQACARAQRRSEGPAPDSATIDNPGQVRAGMRRARPGTWLLPDGAAVDGEDGMPVAAMSSNVGGMGAHWTAACPSPGESERIRAVEGFDELLTQAKRLLGVTTDAFETAPFAQEVRRRLAGEFDGGRALDRRVQPMPLAVHRRADGSLAWSGSDVVFGDVSRDNPNLTLVDEALVRRVAVKDAQAVGVEVEDRTDATVHRIRAHAVVVAADSLRTPQLLWASGVRPPALGRYLNDQAQVVFAARLSGAADHPDAVRAAGTPAGVLDEQSGVSWVPYVDTAPFHGQVMQLDASPIPLAETDDPIPGSIVGLGWFCAKDLRAEDRVEFHDLERDAYGMPAIRIRYRLTERDHETIARAKAQIRRAAAALGEPIGDEPFLLPLGSSLHYQGTVRLGADDDGTSVCDPNSRVWGHAGLYVAGNGVIPTAIACNPTLTAVALAIRGARDVARYCKDWL
ncbi:GMC oxidoreductase [Salinactinospora qingdaonensis]|uniref:GMC family oxidoreductase n=1 Tax=Salinactinospora qingdaonensis TaxID=702744 RepID=A0ABP7G825_9ACTN